MVRSRHSRRWKWIAWGLALGAGLGPAAAASPLDLVPAPREVRARPGSVQLSPEWRIVAPADSADRWAAALLSEEARACYGWSWPLVATRSAAPAIELRSAPAGASLPIDPQGYRIAVEPTGVTIEGSTAQGRYYGVQTLRQILRVCRDGRLPRGTIVDWPALAWRGVSDDVSRGQVSTLADFRATIRQLAFYKINLYQPYIENVFAFDMGGSAPPRPGAITRAELSEMVEEGRRNHVAVCPIFQTLAHQEGLLSRPEFRALAARRSGPGAGDAPAAPAARWAVRVRGLMARVASAFTLPAVREREEPRAFSTTSPRILESVQELLDQIADIGLGPFVHIGGDEWDDRYEVRSGGALGPGEAGRRYGRYVAALCEHVRQRYGRRTMVYGDVLLAHPEAAPELPRDAVIVDWQYHPADSFPSLGRLRRLGFDQIMVSPGLWTWKTFYPNYAWGCRNVARFAEAGKRAGAIGCVTSVWGDDGAENLRENNWLGYAFGAAASWEAGSPEIASFPERFVAVHYGSASPELADAERTLGWQEFEGLGFAGRVYHRPPLVRPRPASWLERMRSLELDMARVERDLQRARPGVRFDREHLDALALCAARFKFVAERERFLDQVARSIEARGVAQPAASEQEDLAVGLSALEARAAALDRQFGRLWLRRNRPEGLEANSARLQRQTRMLGRLLERARAGRLVVDRSWSGMQARGL